MHKQRECLFRWQFILIFVLFCFHPGIAQTTVQNPDSLLFDIRISARVEKTKVPLNRILKLHITLSWLGGPDRFSVEPFDNPALTNFDIVATATANRTEVREGKTYVILDHEYSLRPRELGMGYIEGVVVKCRDTLQDREQTLVTQRIPVEIIDPVPEPGSGPSGWIYVFPALLLMLLGVAVYLWLGKRRAQKLAEEIPPPLPLETIYLEDLRKSVDLNTPDLRADFARLSRLVRRYLAEKFGMEAKGMTTDEVAAQLRETDLDGHVIDSIREVLVRCDEIKFSGMAGEQEELTRFYTLVEGMLESQRKKEQEAT